MNELRINVRVSQEQKANLTKAANARRKTLTSFMVEAALTEARAPFQESTGCTAGFSGIPSFMVANLHIARRGGKGGYRNAGWHFAIHILSLDPLSADGDEDWGGVLETEFRPILEALECGEEVAVQALAKWMKTRFPEIAKQVPTRRWAQFAAGMFQAHEEGRVL